MEEETVWGRSERYEEEGTRLRQKLEAAEKEHLMVALLLRTTDGRTLAFKYLKRRHREIGELIWAIKNVDLRVPQEAQS